MEKFATISQLIQKDVEFCQPVLISKIRSGAQRLSRCLAAARRYRFAADAHSGFNHFRQTLASRGSTHQPAVSLADADVLRASGAEPHREQNAARDRLGALGADGREGK